MSEDASQIACEKFQRRLYELIASDEPIEEHPHYKACMICRCLVRSFEEMIEETLSKHIAADDKLDSPRSDDWPECT